MFRRLCSLSLGSVRVLNDDVRKLSSKLWHKLHPRSFYVLTRLFCCRVAHFRSPHDFDTDILPGKRENSSATVGTSLAPSGSFSSPGPVTPEAHTQAITLERSRKRTAYETACRKGFLGTYDEWTIQYMGSSKLGGLCFRSDICRLSANVTCRRPHDVMLGESP